MNFLIMILHFHFPNSNHLPSRIAHSSAGWGQTSVQHNESDNAYSAWQLHQSSEHNLQIQQSSLGGHQVTRVHPLHFFHEINS